MLKTYECVGVGNCTSYTVAQLDQAATGELVGPEAPVLPARPWRIFGDIINIGPAEGAPDFVGLVRAKWQNEPDHPVYKQHFLNWGVLPGLFLADQLVQLAGFYTAHMGCVGRGFALGTDETHFKLPVTPEINELVYLVQIRQFTKGSRRSTVRADGAIYADEKKAVEVKGIKVMVSL